MSSKSFLDALAVARAAIYALGSALEATDADRSRLTAALFEVRMIEYEHRDQEGPRPQAGEKKERVQ